MLRSWRRPHTEKRRTEKLLLAHQQTSFFLIWTNEKPSLKPSLILLKNNIFEPEQRTNEPNYHVVCMNIERGLEYK